MEKQALLNQWLHEQEILEKEGITKERIHRYYFAAAAL